MGITETIARDTAEYVAIAARLGQDKQWRAEQSRRIVERRELLYDDPTPVKALEQFLLTAVDA